MPPNIWQRTQNLSKQLLPCKFRIWCTYRLCTRGRSTSLSVVVVSCLFCPFPHFYILQYCPVYFSWMLALFFQVAMIFRQVYSLNYSEQAEGRKRFHMVNIAYPWGGILAFSAKWISPVIFIWLRKLTTPDTPWNHQLQCPWPCTILETRIFDHPLLLELRFRFTSSLLVKWKIGFLLLQAWISNPRVSNHSSHVPMSPFDRFGSDRRWSRPPVGGDLVFSFLLVNSPSKNENFVFPLYGDAMAKMNLVYTNYTKMWPIRCDEMNF